VNYFKAGAVDEFITSEHDASDSVVLSFSEI
jgi:hypothetical protein